MVDTPQALVRIAQEAMEQAGAIKTVHGKAIDAFQTEFPKWNLSFVVDTTQLLVQIAQEAMGQAGAMETVHGNAIAAFQRVNLFLTLVSRNAH